MKLSKLLLACLASSALWAGCVATQNGNSNTTATTAVTPPGGSPSPAAQNLTKVETPQRIKDMSAERGQQDQAQPVLSFLAPRDGDTINGSTVNVKLDLRGDLKGYRPMKDPSTGMGNHIHVILDNQPYEAYYNLDQPFELRNVTEGRHTLRVFASRPWHESYKNEGSFQMAVFTVRGGGDPNRPTTTNTGQVMADNRAAGANANAAPAATPEGKDYAGRPNAAGEVDKTKPLLTYSRPKGEYKGADADPVMIDFWLTNVKLEGDGGEYRVRYTVDGGPPAHLTKWEPVWLKGWAAGKHRVKLELVDRNDDLVQNGGFNSTEREITITK